MYRIQLPADQKTKWTNDKQMLVPKVTFRHFGIGRLLISQMSRWADSCTRPGNCQGVVRTLTGTSKPKVTKEMSESVNLQTNAQVFSIPEF